MPDMGHVIALAQLLKRASREYRLMVKSGFDRGLAANEELKRLAADGEISEEELQAASVWLDFLSGLHEAQLYDDEQERMENE